MRRFRESSGQGVSLLPEYGLLPGVCRAGSVIKTQHALADGYLAGVVTAARDNVSYFAASSGLENSQHRGGLTSEPSLSRRLGTSSLCARTITDFAHKLLSRVTRHAVSDYFAALRGILCRRLFGIPTARSVGSDQQALCGMDLDYTAAQQGVRPSPCAYGTVPCPSFYDFRDVVPKHYDTTGYNFYSSLATYVVSDSWFNCARNVFHRTWQTSRQSLSSEQYAPALTWL